MKRWNQLSVCLLGYLLLSLAYPSDAHAYLDPGAGSIIFQVAIALFFGMIVTLRLWWAKARSFVVGLFSRNTKNTQ